MSRQPDRAGFVLLVVLWGVIAVTIIGSGMAATAQRATQQLHDARAYLAAEYHLSGCLAWFRSRINEADDSIHGSAVESSTASRLVDVARGLPRPCDATVHALGVRLDVNSASQEDIIALLRYHGASPGFADSLSAAIIDWRDIDDVPLSTGAEAPWYEAAGVLPPRNDRLLADREVMRVRGASVMPRLAEWVGPDTVAIALSDAPWELLATLPGVSPRLARAIEGRTLSDWTALPRIARPTEAVALAQNWGKLTRRATLTATKWHLDLKTTPVDGSDMILRVTLTAAPDGIAVSDPVLIYP